MKIVHDQTTVGAPASVGSFDLRQSLPDAEENVAGLTGSASPNRENALNSRS